jgi:hypothetical protein
MSAASSAKPSLLSRSRAGAPVSTSQAIGGDVAALLTLFSRPPAPGSVRRAPPPGSRRIEVASYYLGAMASSASGSLHTTISKDTTPTPPSGIGTHLLKAPSIGNGNRRNGEPETRARPICRPLRHPRGSLGCGLFVSDGRLEGKGGVRGGWRGEQERSGREHGNSTWPVAS